MSVISHFKNLDLARYHVLIIFGLCAVLEFIRLAFMHFPLYANVIPQWACVEDAHFRILNNTSDVTTARTLSQHVILSYSQNCSVYYACESQNGSLLFRSPYFSVRQEFNLVCDRAYQASLVASVQFVGFMTGSNLFGWISDRFGRKRVLSCLILAEAGFGFASSFAFGPISLGSLRFCAGIFTGGDFAVLAIFMLETMPPKQRVFMRAVASTPTYTILLVPIWYVWPNWRFCLRVLSIIEIPTFFLLVALIPESVKWATDRNKEDLAIKSQKRIDWINGKYRKTESKHSGRHSNLDSNCEHLPLSPQNPETDNKLTAISEPMENKLSQSQSKKSAGLRSLFSARKLRGVTIALCVMWPSMAVASNVIRIDGHNLAGDFYLNQVWMGLAAMLSSLVLLALDCAFPRALRRRTLYQIPQLIVIILASIAVACLAAGGAEAGALGFVVTGCAVLAGFFARFMFDAVYLSTGEVFPTEIRASAFAMCSTISWISVALTPQIVLFRQTWPPGPYLVMMVLGVLALILSYKYQPETQDKQLPVSLQEASEAAKL